MTNSLLEGYDINAPWLLESLKDYTMPFHKKKKSLRRLFLFVLFTLLFSLFPLLSVPPRDFFQ